MKESQMVKFCQVHFHLEPAGSGTADQHVQKMSSTLRVLNETIQYSNPIYNIVPIKISSENNENN